MNFWKKTVFRAKQSRQLVAAVYFLCLSSYSVYREMQTLCIFSAILSLFSLYINYVKRGVEIFFELARQTQMAKYKDFEVNLNNPEKAAILNSLGDEHKWIRGIFEGMSTVQFSLFFAIGNGAQEDFLIESVSKDALRVLRDRGLLKHDASTMEKSTTVYLTDFGKEIVDLIKNKKTK